MGSMTAFPATDRLSDRPKRWGPRLAILAVGCIAAIVIRLALLPSYVLLGDLDQYARWAHRLATDLPFGAAYRQDMSYMPVLIAVFGAVGRLVPAFANAGDASTVGVRLALKLPGLLGELAIVAGLVTLLRARPHLAVAVVLAVLLVPASWYLSAWWGQLDAVYVAFALWAAILASRDRHWLFAVVLGLAMMTKPQALFLAPPFAGYAIGRWGMRRAALVGICAAGIALLTWLPFLPFGGPVDYLRDLDYYQNGVFPILSVRAWNPWWLLQVSFAGNAFVSDSTPLLGPLTPRYLGIVMTAIAELTLFVTVLRRASAERLFMALTAATLAAFSLMTSMHERYAYASLVLLAPLLSRRSIQVVWVTLGAAISLNLVAGAPPDQMGQIIPVAGPVGTLGSIAMILATAIMFALLLGNRSDRTDALRPQAGNGATVSAAP